MLWSGLTGEHEAGNFADLAAHVLEPVGGLPDLQRQLAKRQPGRWMRPAIIECIAVMMIMDRCPVVAVRVAVLCARRSR